MKYATGFGKIAALTALSLQVPGWVSASLAMRTSSTAASAAKLEGMPYLQARAIILRYGWRPQRGECSGPPVSDTVCSQFPEIEYCSGNGVGYCGMDFFRENRCLILTTIGGLPGEGSVVRDVTFHRRPCPKN